MTTWTETDDSRRSAAPTVSAAREPPGPEMLPYPGRRDRRSPPVRRRACPAAVRRRLRGPRDCRRRPRTVPPRPRAPPSPRRAPRRRRSGRPRARAQRRVDRSVRSRPAPARFALPAGSSDRKDRCAEGDSIHASWPLGTDHQACHLRPVPLEAGRVSGSRSQPNQHRRRRRRILCHLSEQVRMPRLHTGVEEGDGHTPSVEARQDDVRTRTGARGQLSVLDQRRGRGGRIGDAP